MLALPVLRVTVVSRETLVRMGVQAPFVVLLASLAPRVLLGFVARSVLQVFRALVVPRVKTV